MIVEIMVVITRWWQLKEKSEGNFSNDGNFYYLGGGVLSVS